MNNDFIEFYKSVLDSIGLVKYTDDGFIYIPRDDNMKDLVNINGKMLVLPTKDNIDSLVVKKEDGSLEVTKILFNPLKESVNRGNSVSLSRVKTWIEKKLAFTVAAVGEMLLILASDKQMQKDTGLEINKFLSSITEAMNNNIKDIVDATSREKWASLYKKTFEKNVGFITLFINKLYKIEGEKYNRATILGSDVYTELLKATKDKPVLGVNLRNKDITVFKLLFEYLIEGLDKDHETYAIGSNDNECPAFISLLKLYIKLGNRLNKIAELVKFVNREIYDVCYNDIVIKIEDLDNIDRFKSQYVNVPDEHEAERFGNKPQSTTTIAKPQIQAIHNTPNIPVRQTPVAAPVVQAPVQQPVEPVQENVPYNEPLTTTAKIQETTNSGVSAALQYLNNRNRNNVVVNSYPSNGGLRGVNSNVRPYGNIPQPAVNMQGYGYPNQSYGYQPQQSPQFQPPQPQYNMGGYPQQPSQPQGYGYQSTPQVGGMMNPRGYNQNPPMERVQMSPYYPNNQQPLNLRGIRTNFPM